AEHVRVLPQRRGRLDPDVAGQPAVELGHQVSLGRAVVGEEGEEGVVDPLGHRGESRCGRPGGRIEAGPAGLAPGAPASHRPTALQPGHHPILPRLSIPRPSLLLADGYTQPYTRARIYVTG